MSSGFVRAWSAFIVALAASASVLAQTLERAIHDAFAAAKLGDASIAYQVIDVADERVLASNNAEAPLIPASNMKLLTTGCALLALGPDGVFETRVLVEGDRLWVVGSGDPALFDPELLEKMSPARTIGDMMTAVAKQVAASGIEGLAEIVVDDRIFDRQWVHPTWPENQLNRWYCAPVSGLNVHANILHVFVKPGAGGGGTPTVRTQPSAPWIEIRNQSRTVTTGQNSVWLARTGDAYTLHGGVRVASQEPIDVTLHDPATFFGRLLAEHLRATGVHVEDAAVRLATGEDPPAPAGARALATITTRVADVVRRCNTDSQNMYAEALLKRLAHEVTGQPGSWASGASVMRMTMSEHLGPSYVASTTIADGSGMSRDNAVSTATLAYWLARVSSDPAIGEVFVQSLARPGEGTLDDRFREVTLSNDVRAKTGYVNGVRSISGFVTHPASGRRLAFSVIINGATGDPAASQARQMQEQVVVIIDRWLANQVRDAAIGG